MELAAAFGLDDNADILLPDGAAALTHGIVARRGGGVAHLMLHLVQYADTDFSGFVYHARYLDFAERGRSNFLRLLGITHTDLLACDPQLAFVVGHMQMDFRMPAKIDEHLLVETVFTEVRGARLNAEQRVSRGGETVWQAHVEAACVDLDGRPRRMPADIAEQLVPYQGDSFIGDKRI